jgi:hypothetical protein
MEERLKIPLSGRGERGSVVPVRKITCCERG